ncbi:LytR C-terminal domain-containing protein [Caenispirillum salinarum]|uniref:LytR C-terminal domain-containing protein n=1 Tax=Caenispirillum salinarum TaxID=859058 RepID=UPI00384DD1F5
MRVLRLSSVCAAALLVVSCAAGGFETRAVSTIDAPAGPAAQLYETGKAHFAAGRWGAAVHAFQAAAARDPRHVGAHNGLAAAYDRLGRFDLADRAYMEALTLAPDDPATLNNMGWSRHLRGQPELARVYLRHAVDLAPEDGVTQANLGAVEAVSAARAAEEEQVAVVPEAADQVPRLTRRDFATVQLVTTRSGARAVSLPMPPPAEAPRSRLAGAAPAARSASPAPVAVAATAAPAPAPAAGRVVNAVLPAAPAAGPVSRGMPVEAGLFDGVTVEVSNGNGIRRMAARTAAWLGDRGVPVRRLTNADTFSNAASAVFWRDAGDAGAARALASLLPDAVTVVHAPDQAADVRLVLGSDLAAFDAAILKQGKDHHDQHHEQVASR